jgi:hypothetical protein
MVFDHSERHCVGETERLIGVLLVHPYGVGEESR